jgi:hypothetical protein
MLGQVYPNGCSKTLLKDLFFATNQLAAAVLIICTLVSFNHRYNLNSLDIMCCRMIH